MKLKELRGNLTQKQICNDLGISVKNLSNYEVGRSEPDIKTLIQFADYFNVSLDYLCGRQWNNQVGYIPDDKKEVVKIILQLNEINTIKLFGYASGLLAGQN
mgnify:CR=1 FL=1